MNLEERFWAKVSPEPNSGCWLWTGCDNGDGYGYFHEMGRNKKAHRASHELFIGPIPEGLQIDHLCRVRCCVNPAHLEPVTQAENIRRGVAIQRMRESRIAITHCPQGHEYAGRNVMITKPGHRRCRTCHCDAERMRYRRKIAA